MPNTVIDPYIPFDKSWLIRLGVLDLLHSRTNIDTFLAAQQNELNSDLLALMTAIQQWRSNLPVNVGESGTLYRFLQFAAWQQKLTKQFIKSGTLQNRSINADSTIVDWPLTKLLTLDNGTSQWASAAVLLGNRDPKPQPLPYKLALTYEALGHWQKHQPWKAKRDRTIAAQANAYLEWIITGDMKFTPQQAEDYCFARAFDLITAAHGEARWPALRHHESDRIEEMEKALTERVVSSMDHRVIQAVALRKGSGVEISHPEVVSKSWPQFWSFYDEFHH